MSGGGGKIGDNVDISVHLRDSHGLIVLGKDGSGENWASSTNALSKDDLYSDNPSVLRYILEKGISDAGGNPFDGVSAYNPETDLDTMQAELNAFMEDVSALEPTEDVPSWLATSSEAADGLPSIDIDASVQSIVTSARLGASQVVADAVTAAGTTGLESVISRARVSFDARTKRDHLNSISQFTGAMSDMQAVNTSAFVIGLAKLQRGLDDRLASFDAEFVLPITRDGIAAFLDAFKSVALQHLDAKTRMHVADKDIQTRYVMQASSLILEQLRLKMSAGQSNVEMQRNISTANIVALTDEMQTNLDIDTKSQNWDLELFQQAGNIISAVSGSVVPAAAKPNRFLSGLAGGLGGAGTGLVSGGVPGAILGGAAGAIGGYME